MVLVMHMGMCMRQSVVRVRVFVALRQMQPDAECHEGAGYRELQ